MLTQVNCQCIIIGEDFNPNSLDIPDSISIIKKIEKGERISDGRFSGKLSNDGSLIISGSVDDVLLFLEREEAQIQVNKLDFFNVTITVEYVDQCNFEISSEQLFRFSRLKIPIGISCYSDKSE